MAAIMQTADVTRKDTDEGATNKVQTVGWVEPTGRANARPMINYAKPITFAGPLMGFARLNPSDKFLG